jgi:type I restriction enzyme R subunit
VREIIRKASGEALDLKAYEADMRHLIDTYIEADEPRKVSPFDDMSLLELIAKTGIADAIATQLGGLKGNKGAIAETIENNVRSTIVREHLNDPAFYETMSALLDEIIAARHRRCETSGPPYVLSEVRERAWDRPVGADAPLAADSASLRRTASSPRTWTR